MSLWEWISLVVGAVGAGFGAVGLRMSYSSKRKLDLLDMQRKTVDWSDLQAASNDLTLEMRREFHPDLVVTPGLTGATFANLVVSNFAHEVPVYVGTRTWRTAVETESSSDHAFAIRTNKWLVSIPRQVLNETEKRVLIVDDFVMSGDFLHTMRKRLIGAGFATDRIKSCAIVTTKVAIRNFKAPDYYWREVEGDDFYFPWGRAR